MDDMKQKMEKKLKELNTLSKKMDYAESLVLPQLTVALEENGKALPILAIIENLGKVFFQANCVVKLQLLSRDIFACACLEELLRTVLLDEKILEIELLNCGKTMPGLKVMSLLQANDVSVSLIHVEGEVYHRDLFEVLKDNNIAVKCVFPDIRVEEAAARNSLNSLVLTGDKLYRVPEAEIGKIAFDSVDDYFIGSLEGSLKAKLMEDVSKEMKA